MKVTVIIPAYNEEKYIERTLQAISGAEIVVVCNGCTDKTEDIARKYADSVIVLKEKGVSRARNAGKDELIDKLKERNILGKDLPEGEQVHYLSEAVNHDPDVLNGYYSDQKGTGEFFDLGTLCFRTVLTSTIKEKKGIVIGNRHPLEARATFIRYGGEHDILDTTAIGLHDIILRRGIEKNVIPIPDMVLYLDVADPEILIKRNQMRMAGGEENLAAQYLRDLAPYFARYRDHF